MIDFLSGYIRQLCFGDNFYVGSLLFIVIFGLLMIFFYQRDMKNYFISIIIKDEYLKLKRDKKTTQQDVTDFLVSHGYSYLSAIMLPVMQVIASLLFGYGLRGKEMADLVVRRLPHAMATSPFELMLAKESGVFYITVTLPVVVFISYYIIVTTESESLVDNRKLRMCLLSAMVSMAMLFPIGYCFSLAILSVIQLVHFKLVTGKLHDQVVEKIAADMKYDVKAFNVRNTDANGKKIRRPAPKKKVEEKPVEKKPEPKKAKNIKRLH